MKKQNKINKEKKYIDGGQIFDTVGSLAPLLNMIPGVGQIAAPLVGLGASFLGNKAKQANQNNIASNPTGYTNSNAFGYADGGSLQGLNSTSQLVTGAPNQIDGNKINYKGQAINLDHGETLDTNRDRVISDKYINPNTGKKIVDEDKALKLARGKAEKEFNRTGDKAAQNTIKRTQEQEDNLYNIQEQVATMKGDRNSDGSTVQQGKRYKDGGPLQPQDNTQNILLQMQELVRKLNPQRPVDELEQMTGYAKDDARFPTEIKKQYPVFTPSATPGIPNPAETATTEYIPSNGKVSTMSDKPKTKGKSANQELQRMLVELGYSNIGKAGVKNDIDGIIGNRTKAALREAIASGKVDRKYEAYLSKPAAKPAPAAPLTGAAKPAAVVPQAETSSLAKKMSQAEFMIARRKSAERLTKKPIPDLEIFKGYKNPSLPSYSDKELEQLEIDKVNEIGLNIQRKKDYAKYKQKMEDKRFHKEHVNYMAENMANSMIADQSVMNKKQRENASEWAFYYSNSKDNEINNKAKEFEDDKKMGYNSLSLSQKKKEQKNYAKGFATGGQINSYNPGGPLLSSQNKKLEQQQYPTYLNQLGNLWPVQQNISNPITPVPEVNRGAQGLNGEYLGVNYGRSEPKDVKSNMWTDMTMGEKVGLGSSALSVALKATDAFGKVQKEPYRYNNAAISLNQLDPTAILNNNQASYQSALNDLNNNSSTGGNRAAIAANLFNNKLRANNDVMTKYGEQNSNLATQYEQRLAQRNSENNAMAYQVDDLNSRNKGAAQNMRQGVYGDLATLGLNQANVLNNRLSQNATLEMLKQMAPDVYKNYMANVKLK